MVDDRFRAQDEYYEHDRFTFSAANSQPPQQPQPQQPQQSVASFFTLEGNNNNDSNRNGNAEGEDLDEAEDDPLVGEQAVAAAEAGNFLQAIRLFHRAIR